MESNPILRTTRPSSACARRARWPRTRFAKAYRRRSEDSAAGWRAGTAKILPKWTEFVPQGRSVFSACTDDQLQGHLQTFLNAAAAHQDDLGDDFHDGFQEVVTAWAAVYSASETATGAKTATQQSRQAARENLQLTLFINLLKIAELNPRHPEKLELFMQQALLEDQPQQPDQPAPTPPPA